MWLQRIISIFIIVPVKRVLLINAKILFFIDIKCKYIFIDIDKHFILLINTITGKYFPVFSEITLSFLPQKPFCIK
jgi:hypothetical protein